MGIRQYVVCDNCGEIIERGCDCFRVGLSLRRVAENHWAMELHSESYTDEAGDIGQRRIIRLDLCDYCVRKLVESVENYLRRTEGGNPKVTLNESEGDI